MSRLILQKKSKKKVTVEKPRGADLPPPPRATRVNNLLIYLLIYLLVYVITCLLTYLLFLHTYLITYSLTYLLIYLLTYLGKGLKKTMEESLTFSALRGGGSEVPQTLCSILTSDMPDIASNSMWKTSFTISGTSEADTRNWWQGPITYSLV